MRNLNLIFVVFIGLAACVPTDKSPKMSPTNTYTSSPAQTITATIQQVATVTLTPVPTSAPTQDLSIIKSEIVDFMLDYIVENEIVAMIDIISRENIPGIEKPPAQFIVIFSPIPRVNSRGLFEFDGCLGHKKR